MEKREREREVVSKGGYLRMTSVVDVRLHSVIVFPTQNLALMSRIV